MTLLSLILFVRNYIRTLRRDTARVPALVSVTLDRLATQAALHDVGQRADQWISVGRLRDDVLREEFSTKRREEIWRRVKAVVEANANVRASVREDSVGEVSRVWEWIGSLPALPDGEGWSSSAIAAEGRRKSGRYSLPGPGDERDEDTPAKQGVIREMGQSEPAGRKWDEGRPLY